MSDELTPTVPWQFQHMSDCRAITVNLNCDKWTICLILCFIMLLMMLFNDVFQHSKHHIVQMS